MKNVAVVLSGCGVFDGSEIHESVLTMLAIDRHHAKYTCVAPNIKQRRVMNHVTQQEQDEVRNVLEEAARLARGDIRDIQQVKVSDFDAAIFPGGFGAALNLSDFAISGINARIEPTALRFAQAMAAAKKPMGFICIAPAMIPLIYGQGAKLTVGHDEATVGTLTAMGATHIAAKATDIVVDEELKIVSTPAYMLAQQISEVADGVEKLVNKILELA